MPRIKAFSSRRELLDARLNNGRDYAGALELKGDIGMSSEIVKELTASSWKEAFKYAGKPEAIIGFGKGVSRAPFSRSDVKFVLAIYEDASGEFCGVVAGKLKDGRYFFLSAWCCHMGWGLHEGGHAGVSASEEDLIRFGLSLEERRLLGLSIPTEGEKEYEPENRR